MRKYNKAYQFRVYPTQEQEVLLNKTFGSCRFIYNKILEDMTVAYGLGQNISLTPAQYKDKYKWLKEVDAQALNQAHQDLNSAFSNRKKNPKHFGFPQFKRKGKDRDSYRSCVVNNNIRIEGQYLRLPKIGMLKIKQHRVISKDFLLKSVTVSKRPSGSYFVALLYEYQKDIRVKEIQEDRVLGLDMALDSLYVDSDGNKPQGQNKHFKEMQDKLAKEQRRLSRRRDIAKKQGKKLSEAKNYQKQRLVVAKLQESIANKRKDFLHKTSHLITKDYDVLMIEDLNMKAMSQGLKLGKSIHDNSWSSFIMMLDYKLSDKGGQLIKIGKSYPSSKMCSSCQHVKRKLALSERTYICHHCGLSMDRDHNAALNVKKEGLRIALHV